jgi:MATE family multidrug resistance protein
MMATLTNTRSFGGEVRQSVRLSLPLIASNVVQASSGFLGTLMVAHLGRDQLAGLALGTSVYFTLIVFLFGVLSAIGVMVAQNFGAQNQEGMELAFAQGFILALISCIPMVLIIWYAPVILAWSGEPLHVTQLATNYLHTIVLCVVPLSMLVSMEQFLIGMGRTRLVLWISLAEVPFEILLSYAFIFGRFGMPKCGVAGIGYGFAIVFLCTAIGIAIFLCRSKLYRQYKLFTRLIYFNTKYFMELLRVGWPIGCMYVIEVALLSVLTFMMGRVSGDALAANRIARQFLLMGMMFVFAVSQVTTVQVGQAVGRKDKIGINRAVLANLVFSCSVTFLISICYVVFARDFISLDVNISDPRLAMLTHYSIIFLIFAGFAQIFDTLRFIAIGALRGLKDTKIPMYISILTFWCIALPIAWLMCFALQLGGAGLWIGLLIGILSGAIILLVRSYKLVQQVNFYV